MCVIKYTMGTTGHQLLPAIDWDGSSSGPPKEIHGNAGPGGPPGEVMAPQSQLEPPNS